MMVCQYMVCLQVIMGYVVQPQYITTTLEDVGGLEKVKADLVSACLTV